MADGSMMKVGKVGKKNKVVGPAKMSLGKGSASAKTAPTKKMA